MKNLLGAILFFGAGIFLCVLPTLGLPLLGIPVAFPHIQLSAERLTGQPILGIPGFYLTNTFTSMLLADVVLLVLAAVAGFMARRRLKRWEHNPKALDAQDDDLLVPKGWQNTFEAIIEYISGLARQIVGAKWAPKIFPIAATIFLLVLTANWMHFVPLVDSVGVMHCADPDGEPPLKGFAPVAMGGGIYRLGFEDSTLFPKAEASLVPCPGHGEGGKEAHADGESANTGLRVVVTPFLRTATTDLNVTLALAVVTMVTVQIFGVMALGPSYFFKFFNLPALSKGFLGWIELGVSWLEVLSEGLKVLSLSLRLFGNIFAGAVLLLVIAYLVPIGLPLIFYLLEILIGVLQALVFMMLCLVFTGVAVSGHGDHSAKHE
ncbi:MAG: F0F1 ATP synthase subunit A [Anaerolineae bacterium]|nr:F0F1 ATP synthase subunit A [Anaerolineae bacterium]